MRRKRKETRIFAGILSAALVVSSAPVQNIGTVQAATIASPQECTAVTTELGDIQSPIMIVDSGRASESGYQATKTVDVKGKTVDMNKKTNTVNALGDGTVLDALEEDTAMELPATVAAPTVEAAASYTSNPSVTAVRNQGSWGLCWAFAATAAIEANVVKNKSKFTSGSYTKDTIDLSERHMGWFAHNTFTTDKNDLTYGDGSKKTTPKAAYTGGNAQQSVAYLARSSGMALESEAPYDVSTAMPGLAETDRYSSVVQLKDWVDLGTYSKDAASIQNATAAIKAAIEKYGAVQASYYSDENYYQRNSKKGRVNYYSKRAGTNHAICIVGWDDNYSASNFKLTPPGDGAWRIKNSWGTNTDADDDGYFWMSYYESSLSAVSAYEAADAASYGRTYCYTADGLGAYMARSATENAAANVYKSVEDESLKSVGVYTVGKNQKVKAEIYVKDSAMTNPLDGSKKATVTKDYDLSGFHMLDLTSAVPLKAGQYFSVVITISTTDGGTAWIATERLSGSKSLTGQTYYYTVAGSEAGWIDSNSKALNQKNYNYNNACIYAYTTDTDNAALLAQLNALVTQGKALKQADVTALAGADAWTNLQTELGKAAKIVTSKQAASLKREIRVLQRVISLTGGKNVYANTSRDTGVGAGGLEIFQNGGSVKKDGVTTNYKSRTFSFAFNRTYSWAWANKSQGKLKGVTSGNYVAAVTSTPTRPALATNGKLAAHDTAAEAVLSAKVSGSKVTVSAKTPGDVYVWVLWYPKSVAYQQERLDDQTEYAMFKVHVGTAPTAVKLYRAANTDPTDTANVLYTSNIIPAGGSTEVYVTGTTGSVSKSANTLKEITASDVGYFPTVPTKYANVVSVTQDAADSKHYTISVKESFMTDMKIKDGKTASVVIPFICDKSGKKINFTVVVSNSVKSMSIQKQSEDTSEATVATGADKVVNIQMPDARTAAKSVIVEETNVLYDSTRKKTDASKLYRMPNKNFTLLANSTVKVTDAIGTAQKKISIAAVSKKPGQYKITAAKGTPAGTEIYLMVWHNSYSNTVGGGYQLIKVTVGEANHNKSIAIKKEAASEGTVTSSSDSKAVTIGMDSAVKASKSVTIEETVTLADTTKEGTDVNAIYRLPYKEGGFVITPGMDVKVTGALTSNQKKVTMAAVKGKLGQYKITAAKGTAEGTECYFLLYHNPQCCSIISVTVGTPNKVSKIELKNEDGTKVSTSKTGENTIAEVSAAYSKTAAQYVTVSETMTLPQADKAKTDVTAVYRMPAADGFAIVENRTAAKVVGSLSSAQKKVSMAAVKGQPGKYKITIAKGTPAGTEVYFMIYHNCDNGASGTGYQIIKVKVN